MPTRPATTGPVCTPIFTWVIGRRNNTQHCDMARHGTPRHTTRHSTTRHAHVRYRRTRHGTARTRAIQEDTARHGAAQHGTHTCDAEGHGTARHAHVRCRRTRHNMRNAARHETILYAARDTQHETCGTTSKPCSESSSCRMAWEHGVLMWYTINTYSQVRQQRPQLLVTLVGKVWTTHQ